jgi:hypothetical protein
MPNVKLNLENKIFGDLKVTQFSHIHKNKSYWKSICLACNNEHTACGSDMKRGKILNCGCTKNKQEKNGQWKGYEGLWGKTVGHYKYNADKRNISFKVSLKYLWEQYLTSFQTFSHFFLHIKGRWHTIHIFCGR